MTKTYLFAKADGCLRFSDPEIPDSDMERPGEKQVGAVDPPHWPTFATMTQREDQRRLLALLLMQAKHRGFEEALGNCLEPDAPPRLDPANAN